MLPSYGGQSSKSRTRYPLSGGTQQEERMAEKREGYQRRERQEIAYPADVQDQYGISRDQWTVLTTVIWPGATDPNKVRTALAYCKARKLDPMKSVIHIVPLWNPETGRVEDSIWRGIAEMRITATRTGSYAGCDPAVFGPDVHSTFEGETGPRDNKRKIKVSVTHPEWCEMTLYRLVQGQRVPFASPRLYWKDSYAHTR